MPAEKNQSNFTNEQFLNTEALDSSTRTVPKSTESLTKKAYNPRNSKPLDKIFVK